MYEAVGHADVPQICCGSTSIRDEEMMEGEVKCGGTSRFQEGERGLRQSSGGSTKYEDGSPSVIYCVALQEGCRVFLAGAEDEVQHAEGFSKLVLCGLGRAKG
jgi:hypothetical protein